MRITVPWRTRGRLVLPVAVCAVVIAGTAGCGTRPIFPPDVDIPSYVVPTTTADVPTTVDIPDLTDAQVYVRSIEQEVDVVSIGVNDEGATEGVVEVFTECGNASQFNPEVSRTATDYVFLVNGNPAAGAAFQATFSAGFAGADGTSNGSGAYTGTDQDLVLRDGSTVLRFANANADPFGPDLKDNALGALDTRAAHGEYSVPTCQSS
jgi:hypothetical protein